MLWRGCWIAVVLAVLAGGASWAASSGVPVTIEADQTLRGGAILVRKDDGPWEKRGYLTGVPRADTLTLENHEKYELRIEKADFWTITWGQTECRPAWELRSQFGERGALLVRIRQDRQVAFNWPNVLLKLVLPCIALAVAVVVSVLRRSNQRRVAAEKAARESHDAANVLATNILARTKIPLPADLRIGGYSIVELIGEGGMASVYKVEDKDQAVYAMKIPHWAALQDPDFANRFEREISICVGLRHPNVIRTYDAGTYDKGDGRQIPYMVMEWLDGQTLDRVLQDRAVLQELPDLEQAMQVAVAMAKALSAAHQKGIIHRDIKAGNVMIARDGSIKVLDFGIARSVNAATLTAMNASFGTPAFMAPEQVDSTRNVDARADLFSLGVVMYATVTYRLPWDDEDPGLLVMRKVASPPPLPRSFNPEVTREYEAIVMKLLQADPRARYQTAEEVLDALKTVPAQSREKIV